MKPARSAVIHLALAAVLFRALVPDGFMVARDDQGTPAVVPCPVRSAELVQLIQSQSGHHHHHQHGEGGTQASAGECPFAASLLTPPPAALAFPVAHLPPAAPAVALPPAIARSGAARKPPATGPPPALG